MESYLPHVGYVQFPRQPLDLTSAVCPACFVARAAQRCPNCGLDLGNPALAELDAATMDVSTALDRRLELIGRIRYETAQAAAVPPVPAPAAAIPTAVPAPAPAAPVAAPATPATPAAPRRHLGVQVVLLIVGVSLLAIGAIFFLVYAFITFGLVWRSIIIGAVTVAAFVSASLLKRRRLRSTAEAIAALAVVLVYLDVFALRANDLFGLGSTDGLVYWGAALLVSSIGFAVWHRLAGLRLPNVVAFSAFAPAVALLVAGLTADIDEPVRTFASFLALAIAALVHPLAGRRVERIITLSFALLGLFGAAVASYWVFPDSDWAPLAGLAIVVGVAAAHVAVLHRSATDPVLAASLAGVGAATSASALLPVALRLDVPEFSVSAPLILATVVALLLELLARRAPLTWLRAAAWSAAGVAGFALLAVGTVTLVRAVSVAALGGDRWSIRGGTDLATEPSQTWSLVALAAVVALVAAGWAVGGVLRARRLTVLSAGLAVLVLAVPLTGQLWLAVLGWLVLAAAGVALLIVGRRRGWGRGIRIAVVATAAAALVLSYSASWASIDTWWFGSVGAVAVLVAARLATNSVAVRAALVGLAGVLAFVAIGAEAWHTNERFRDGSGAAVEAVHAVLLLAALLVGVAFLLRRRLSVPETRVLFWMSFATAVVTAAMSASFAADTVERALVLPEFGTSVALAALLVAALVPWMLGSRFPAEAGTASLALAPAAAWLAVSLARLLDAPSFGFWVAPVAAAVIVAAISAVLPTSRGERYRGARDAGAVAVLLPVLVASVALRLESTWLALVLGGVAVLFLAVSRDGLFRSVSPRKHLGWVALALAFAGLAWALAERGVRDVEAYVLPLTGALLIVALLAWRTNRASTFPAVVALGALLASIVPLGAVSGTGSLTRTLVVAGVCAALALVGSALRGSVYLDVAAIAGATGLLVAGFARPVALATAGAVDDPALDVWLAATLIVLLLAGIGQGRGPGAVRDLVTQVVIAVALTGVVIVELAVLRETPLGSARALTLVIGYSALFVVALLVRRSPFTTITGWVAVGLAGVVALTGWAVGALDPVEWGTIPLALALLLVGALRLRRDSTASSWEWAAPGLLALLLPSLIATFLDEPVWRLVALGLACVAAIVVGATRALQAPLLLGAAIVLIHAIRTFAPQLVAVYQATEWWVWAVIGGAIIIFVAVTFERRMRDLKSVGTRIGALR